MRRKLRKRIRDKMKGGIIRTGERKKTNGETEL